MIPTSRSAVAPGAVLETATVVVVVIGTPPTKAITSRELHAQVPVFRTRQILFKDCPGATSVPSGTVTSVIKTELFKHAGVGVGVGETVGASVAATVMAMAAGSLRTLFVFRARTVIR